MRAPEREYRVTMAGTGENATEWHTVASGFGSVLGAARWLYDTHNTDNPEAPLRIERWTGAFWADCFVVLPAGTGSVKAWETRELALTLCGLLGDFRRACYQDSMAAEEREHFAHVIDMLEGALCESLRPAECPSDAETLRTFNRIRRALLGDGLSLEDRGQLAVPGGVLDQIEAYVLAVLQGDQS